MKSLFRNAALALSVLSLGAAVAKPVSIKNSALTKVAAATPIPMCPTSSPNGCGIYD